MRKKNAIFYLALFAFCSSGFAQMNDSAMIRKIFNEALSNGEGYSNLDYLSNKIGGRLSGSENAEKAVVYVESILKNLSVDSVFKQACMVPHWVRGDKEIGKIGINDSFYVAQICALGGSIGTGDKGIKAKVVEVHSFEELEKLGMEKIAGKIVFYNRPMDPNKINTMHAYGGANNQRYGGAMKAAPYGAVGVVVRSMTLSKQDYPHTGSMGYADSIPKIPGCAISTNDADYLSFLLKSNPNLDFYFKMNCQKLADVQSFNVVGEIKGSEKPEKIIVVGGHLDSWDTGDGAHDDGAGVVQSLEVLRILKALNYKPKCTIRAVAFMNEENGRRGGSKYAELAKLNNESHIAALESDAGGFSPRGFSIEAPQEVRKKVQTWRNLLEPYGLYEFSKTGSGSDIEPLVEMGTAGFGLNPDTQRYFDYHHAPSDTFDKINKRELELGGAAMAALIYLIDQKGLK
jgi:carboxypeptidase Q